MRRIDLDFVTHRRAGIAGWLILFAGIAAAGAVVAWQQLNQAPRLAEREARWSELDRAIAARQPAPVRGDDKQLAADWSKAIAVAGDLNLPWEQLFATFESQKERPVALLSLEPDAVKHEIVVTAEAKNFDEMLSFYRYLQDQPIFHAVSLHAHQVNQQDREKPIRFRITAAWGAKS